MHIQFCYKLYCSSMFSVVFSEMAEKCLLFVDCSRHLLILLRFATFKKTLVLFLKKQQHAARIRVRIAQCFN